MSVINETLAAAAGGTTPPATVKVWDPLVRVLHWSLVALFAIAFLTGDEVEPVHVAAALAILAAGPADAGSLGRICTTAPPAQWLSVDALQAKVEALGYTVRSGKLKNACGEFYATDKTGARVELFVDPTDGTVVGKL